MNKILLRPHSISHFQPKRKSPAILLRPALLHHQLTAIKTHQSLISCQFLQAPRLIFKSRFGGHGRSCQVTELRQDLVKVSPNRNSFNGFSTCSMREDLANMKCVPCESKDIRPMVEQSAHELIPKVPGWNLINEDGTLKLQRLWKVKSFTKGLEFFNAVANIAEAEGHHPDLHLVGWNTVKIEIWTHSVGGLTENDFILAAKINTLDLQHLLRKKQM